MSVGTVQLRVRCAGQTDTAIFLYRRFWTLGVMGASDRGPQSVLYDCRSLRGQLSAG